MATKKTTRRRSSSGGGAIKAAIASIAGGATGALAGHVMRDLKVSATTVGLGLTGAGLVGAMTLSGTGRWFAAGLATSGASQVTTSWAEEALKRKSPDGAISVLPLLRNQEGRRLIPGDIVAAFEEADREIELERNAAR